MRLDLQLVRLMAAMIITIIAYVAPSAVQAHEGHAHRAQHHVTVETAQAAPIAEQAPSKSVTPAVSQTQGIAGFTALPVAAVGSVQADDQGRGCCPGPCRSACCGTMSCCVSGMLSGPASLPTLASGHVVMALHDVEGRPGIGPEALPRPPRTLA